MKKNAFTLIELLAVILILAIIALIATPAVLNVIEDSKKAAAESSARSIVSAAETYYVKNIMEGTTVSKIILEDNILKYDGDQAEKGYVNLDTNGKGSGKMYISGYCVTVVSKSEVSSEKVDIDKCDTAASTEKYTIYSDGTPLYFNPTTGLKCSESEAVSTYETKSGCMRWFAFLDSEDSANVKLLLDHNILSFYNDISESSSAKDTLNSAISKLNEATSDWKASTSTLNKRFITVEEIAKIINVDYSIVKENGSYTFSGVKDYDEVSNYWWLFDNTWGCSAFGGVNSDNSASTYMTGTTFETEYRSGLWNVGYHGTVENYSSNDGIRPVIEISKKIFE